MRVAVRAVPYPAIAVLIVAPALLSSVEVSDVLVTGSFAGVGLFLTRPRPREIVGWLLVAFVLFFETVVDLVAESQDTAATAGQVIEPSGVALWLRAGRGTP
jgi:hypothetical protein